MTQSADSAVPELPPVSVIAPVLNEEHHLADAVGRVLAQDYAGQLELVLAVAPSADRTEELAKELASGDSRIKVVANPSGSTPKALNLAISASQYDVVVRIDGHALIPKDYVRNIVQVMTETGADNVGGVMDAVGETPFQQAVARAMTTRLGVGGASFHVGGEPGPALTVYLGAFRRSALERVGGFDETFRRAQDWEMNYRIRLTGGLVYFDPKIRVTYRPRRDAVSLAKQYFNTGRWRAALARTHPETVSLRYLAAPITVALTAGGAVLAGVGVVSGRKSLLAGALAPAGYLAIIGAGSAVNGRGLSPAAWRQLPLVYFTMHHAWGLGFLVSSPTLERGN